MEKVKSGGAHISINKRDTGGPPELKSDEKQDGSLLFIEILDCEQIFTAGKVLPFIGASVQVSLRLARSVAAESGPKSLVASVARRVSVFAIAY